jgi:hypothetical protein
MNSGAIVKKEVAIESIGNGLHFVIHYRRKVFREAVTWGWCKCALEKFGNFVNIWKGA